MVSLKAITLVLCMGGAATFAPPSSRGKALLTERVRRSPQYAGSKTTLAAVDAKNDASGIAKAYTVAGVASAAVWSASSFMALSVHPSLALPLRHNVLTIGHALFFPMSIGASVFVALRAAALSGGWSRLQSHTYRRLNLALVAGSLWLAAATGPLAPAFTTGYDVLPPNLKALAAVVHGATAGLALVAWGKSIQPFSVSRMVEGPARGFVGSIFTLLGGLAVASPPHGSLDDPDSVVGRSGAAEYTAGCALLAAFAVASVWGPFPAATVPSFLGKRLSRPAAAFTWLGAVVCYCLRDGALRGRLHASTFRTLRRGLGVGSGLHLSLALAKLAGADVGGRAGLCTLYPAALAAPAASGLSLATHALLLYTAFTPPKDGGWEVSVPPATAEAKAAPKAAPTPPPPKPPPKAAPAPKPKPSLPAESVKLTPGAQSMSNTERIKAARAAEAEEASMLVDISAAAKPKPAAKAAPKPAAKAAPTPKPAAKAAPSAKPAAKAALTPKPAAKAAPTPKPAAKAAPSAKPAAKAAPTPEPAAKAASKPPSKPDEAPPAAAAPPAAKEEEEERKGSKDKLATSVSFSSTDSGMAAQPAEIKAKPAEAKVKCIHPERTKPETFCKDCPRRKAILGDI